MIEREVGAGGDAGTVGKHVMNADGWVEGLYPEPREVPGNGDVKVDPTRLVTDSSTFFSAVHAEILDHLIVCRQWSVAHIRIDAQHGGVLHVVLGEEVVYAVPPRPGNLTVLERPGDASAPVSSRHAGVTRVGRALMTVQKSGEADAAATLLRRPDHVRSLSRPCPKPVPFVKWHKHPLAGTGYVGIRLIGQPVEIAEHFLLAPTQLLQRGDLDSLTL